MTSRVGAFHHKHGSNVRLLENGTVAHRVESYNKAVVFTERPISVGAMYKVKLLDKGGGWAGSIVSHVMLIFLIAFFVVKLHLSVPIIEMVAVIIYLVHSSV